ncbi:MFS general substrate transporter [Cucurbitaria berberidis CBS 394.84]|uniref:MFS general substrate transporter n=1 Tax=Cucurbitaria berberidis CBS 394.84 TaxID=1168544 RepID=A0A9P4GG29_9PLEO|nr:MFS general substrate transporter [Cucurbitaria berberidis CBS 394.84]KAF1844816.1 MFS general substrate transporter [Cucurbitaria berberidis CBS 394.84]
MPTPPSNHDRPTVKASDETTPLLASVETALLAGPADPSHEAADGSAEEAVGQNNDQGDADQVPLPKAQIFLLCYTRVVEPIAFFSIFPYINFMIEKVGGVEKEDVGFYSGLIESLFSATQMCVMIFWGRASDKWGRKPILVISLFGIAISTTLFGLSQSLWQMILARCVAGVFAGTVVTVRAMLSENSTKYTQARAFSYFAFAGNLGLLFGPLLGGLLERPAEKFTSTFGKVKFFQDYPYALPNMVTSAVAISAAITTLLFVKETLHIHHSNKKASGPPMSAWQLIRYPGVTPVLLVYNYVMLLAFTFTAVYPVFQYTPVRLGGLGFTPELIAACTGLTGASQAIWLLFIFPVLHRRVGTGRLLWWCACVWPVFFALNPMFSVMLSHGKKALFWSTGPPTLVLGSGVAMAFTGVQLALNDIAPSHETLGTLNAIALAAQSGLRAVAPALATSLYAIGVKYHILGGELFWLCNVGLALGLLGVLRRLPAKAKGEVTRQRNGGA